ncbi:hypothetical protein EDF81_0727 [Enterobacter sp. BIGb0383]|uniref:hypothetical protein n=1 Tax=unclassified Enterobacter TaxID=2608935 RepID=UPI000F4AA2BC|nr:MULTISPECIES: hypothetical protein [unclassified Enterobacter]ROP62244.1 hypothetical protein EDF81_0727 [Enterobacter sp. BIGb0383]ROS12405.1 hypothetical protein EC848_0729 [Enterobacter sp. BIGb0359]
MAITTLARRIIKTCYFIISVFAFGHLLPHPESYLRYGIVRKIALFISDDVNAESVYDAYSYIDWFIILAITILFYKLTMMLINRAMSK